jgi:hypothetical protein
LFEWLVGAEGANNGSGQIFRRGANHLVRVSFAIVVLGAGLTGAVVWAVWSSPYMTRQGIALEQPAPFSHEHHNSGLGIDCRYCHTTVETGSSAGMPPTETCMTCHSQVWTEAPVLRPVRESWSTGRPIRWNRVHDTPDFVFFNHGIHVQKGIGCSACHGQVDQMPLVRQEHTLWMKWCLECHKNPAEQIRPKEEVFNMAYEQPKNQEELGRQLVARYQVDTTALRDCSMCHR